MNSAFDEIVQWPTKNDFITFASDDTSIHISHPRNAYSFSAFDHSSVLAFRCPIPIPGIKKSLR